MCLALERTQHGATCWDRTQDLLIQSPKLYHYAKTIFKTSEGIRQYFLFNWEWTDTMVGCRTLVPDVPGSILSQGAVGCGLE